MIDGLYRLLTHATVATGSALKRFEIIHDGALVIKNQTILWVGQYKDLPKPYHGIKQENLNNRLVTPGFIDCHTHLVHGGHRAEEFKQRLHGESYEDILNKGGGILSTVRATKDADETILLNEALNRVDALLKEGISTIEIKSGYGLDVACECKMLRVARRIATLRKCHIRTSFLGAHTLPIAYKNAPDAYIENVCIPALQSAHADGLVDAVDGFCEKIAFKPKHIQRLFEAARALGLPVKLHAEQLSNQGGAKLVARYRGLSADHLEYLDEEGVQMMAKANTVAVLLPGAFYALRGTHFPPIDLLRKYNVPLAVATDYNPGSSPIFSLLAVMNMGCILFRLTPEEVFLGVTVYAAKALGLHAQGMISPNYEANLAIWNYTSVEELVYWFGGNPLYKRIFLGEDV